MRQGRARQFRSGGCDCVFTTLASGDARREWLCEASADLAKWSERRSSMARGGRSASRCGRAYGRCHEIAASHRLFASALFHGRVCVGADRGMISAATIEGLTRASLTGIGARKRSDAIVRRSVREGEAHHAAARRAHGGRDAALRQAGEVRRQALCRLPHAAQAEKTARIAEAIITALDAQLEGEGALGSAYGPRGRAGHRSSIWSAGTPPPFDTADRDAASRLAAVLKFSAPIMRTFSSDGET